MSRGRDRGGFRSSRGRDGGGGFRSSRGRDGGGRGGGGFRGGRSRGRDGGGRGRGRGGFGNRDSGPTSGWDNRAQAEDVVDHVKVQRNMMEAMMADLERDGIPPPEETPSTAGLPSSVAPPTPPARVEVNATNITIDKEKDVETPPESSTDEDSD